MKLAIRLPVFLLPRAMREELERRSVLTGRASVGKEWLAGGIGITATLDTGNQTSDKR